MARAAFYRRRFLNKRGFHAGAYVHAEISLDRTLPGIEPGNSWVRAVLTIADCSRVVTLDFDVADEAEARNALHKIRILREVVASFSDALEQSVERWRLER